MPSRPQRSIRIGQKSIMSAGSMIPGPAGLFSLRPRSLSRCLVSAARIPGQSHERGMPVINQVVDVCVQGGIAVVEDGVAVSCKR